MATRNGIVKSPPINVIDATRRMRPLDPTTLPLLGHTAQPVLSDFVMMTGRTDGMVCIQFFYLAPEGRSEVARVMMSKALLEQLGVIGKTTLEQMR